MGTISHTFFLRVFVLLFSNNNFVPGVKTKTCGGLLGIVHKDHSGLANIRLTSGVRGVYWQRLRFMLGFLNVLVLLC